MTKSELIDAVARRGNITKSRAEQVVNCVFDAMTSSMERDEGIEIRGFGSFTVRQYKSYTGRNPRTGDEVTVLPKRSPYFKVGKELRELVKASPVDSAEPEGASDASESEATASAPQVAQKL